MCGLTYALEVSVNGKSYGCVRSEQEADLAIDMLSEEIVTDGSLSPKTDFNYTLTSSASLITPDTLYSEIVNGDEQLATATLVYVNGNAAASATSVLEAENKLSEIAGDNSFYNDIEVADCVIDKDKLASLPKLDEAVENIIPTYIEYKVGSGENVNSVASKFGIDPILVEVLNLQVDITEDNMINIVTDLPAFALVTRSERTNKYGVSAGVYGTKSGTVTETINDICVDGIIVNTQTVNSVFVENHKNKPVASTVKSVGSKGFCWPVDPSYKNYVSSYWGDGRGHQAVDIACKVGTPVLSSASGKVVSINASGTGYGLHFVIDHGNGLKTLYAHCSKLYVSVGDAVEKGEVVALSGNTGRSTGPHLHFEVYKNGAKVNPCSYLGI